MKTEYGRVEQIMGGNRRLKLPFGIVIEEQPDILCINNGRPWQWIFSIFTGYRQLGTFKVKRNSFTEDDCVKVLIEENKGRTKIIAVEKIHAFGKDVETDYGKGNL